MKSDPEQVFWDKFRLAYFLNFITKFGIIKAVFCAIYNNLKFLKVVI